MLILTIDKLGDFIFLRIYQKIEMLFYVIVE